MNTLRSTHDRELKIERDANNRLNIKMDRLVEYTQVVEQDRDDLREAVVALVEKGSLYLLS